jgi:pimeloyl-ACP methyl ester carboxylesterase
MTGWSRYWPPSRRGHRLARLRPLRPPPARPPYDARHHHQQQLDALRLDRVVLVGHDAGGPDAIDYAVGEPGRVEQLVLLNTYYGHAPTLRLPEAIRLLADPNLTPLAGLFRHAELHLDRALVAHVAFIDNGEPVCIPMLLAFSDGRIHVHGSTASRAMRLLSLGEPACLTVTLLHGLVLARSAFEHTVNYESVIASPGLRAGIPLPQSVRRLRAATGTDRRDERG